MKNAAAKPVVRIRSLGKIVEKPRRDLT